VPAFIALADLILAAEQAHRAAVVSLTMNACRRVRPLRDAAT